MNLRDEHEVAVTRHKLRSLEARYDAIRQAPAADATVRELTLRSLRRMIDQMKDEIARFEAQTRGDARGEAQPGKKDLEPMKKH